VSPAEPAGAPAPADARHRSWEGSPLRRTWAGLPLVPRRTILLLVFVAIWEAYIQLAHVNRLVFSSPDEVARAFVAGWAGGAIAQSTAVTLRVLVIGMLIGMAVATLLTVFATWTTLGQDVLTLFTSMLNPLPSIAILPLAMLWFGLNDTALIFVVANAVVWPIAINVSMGFRTVNPTIAMVGKNIGLRGVRYVKDVLLVASLPYIITGVKVGWAFAWRTIIAAELVFGTAGGSGGLGFYLDTSRYFLHIPDVFAGLVTIAVIGIVVEALFNQLEKRTVVRWGMKAV
jgi:NitT/TauT family transport system permease protein